MINRRRHKRIGLEHMEIPAKTIITSECKILDMGLNGVRLLTTQWLNMNNNYTIRFNIDGKPVSNKGTVKWVRLIDNVKNANQDSMPIYMTGIEFQSVYTDNGKDMRQIVDECSANGEHRLSGTRLKIKSPGKAVFNILQEYPIRQISSGGMLVETDHELPLERTLPWAFNFPGDNHIVRCDGRIVSSLKSFGKKQKRFKHCVAFVDLPKENRAHLARFILKAMCSEVKTAPLH